MPDDLKKIVATDIDSEQGEDGGGKGAGHGVPPVFYIL